MRQKNSITNGKKLIALTLAATLVIPFGQSLLSTNGTRQLSTVHAQEPTTAAEGTQTSESTTNATSETSITNTTTAQTALALVKELRVSNQSMTSITLEWDSTPNADGYILQSFNESTNTWSDLTTVSSESDKKMYTYIVSNLMAGTAHQYRICIYQGEKTNRSSYTNSIQTGCQPSVTQVATIKGSQAVRLNWTKVSADGYHIYMKSGTGSYIQVGDITDSTTTTYRKNNLSNGVTYTFKVSPYNNYSGTDAGVNYNNTIENDVDNGVSVIPGTVGKTSTSAYLFGNKTSLKASKAYKTYALAKKLNYTKSFVMPGIANTNVNGINSSSFLAQGSVCAKTYYLVGGYDTTGVENSVIYVMKRSTHQYVMTLVLPNTNKITDMAFDGTNIWMTNGSELASVRYSAITSLISTKLESTTLSYMKTYTTIANPYYLGYYNNTLWVGSFQTSTNYMSGYTINNMTSWDPTLTYNYRMQIPGKTKALTIDSNGMMYLTRSYQVKKGLSGYISQVRSYSPSWTTVSSTRLIKKNSAKKVCKLPAMASGITIYNTYTYINFESAKESGCNYPTDRSWAIKTYRLH